MRPLARHRIGAQHLLGSLALASYAGVIVLANTLTARYGLVPVAPGLLATAGTYAAGAALLLRDAVQDCLGRVWVVAGVLLGAAITAATSPALAAASTTAFMLAELADMAVYTPLRPQGWARAVVTSNAVGALADTTFFLMIAGFPLTVASVGGQLVGKVVWATLLPVVTVLAAQRVRRDHISRHTVRG